LWIVDKNKIFIFFIIINFFIVISSIMFELSSHDSSLQVFVKEIMFLIKKTYFCQKKEKKYMNKKNRVLIKT
jgi:hypothetical protein